MWADVESLLREKSENNNRTIALSVILAL